MISITSIRTLASAAVAAPMFARPVLSLRANRDKNNLSRSRNRLADSFGKPSLFLSAGRGLDVTNLRSWPMRNRAHYRN